jgi:hypothetical protein
MGRVFDVVQLDVSRLLEQWRWLCRQSVTLVARNGFGDMFLRTNDRKILWLSVGGGSLTEIAESELGFEHSLADSAKRELWFAEERLAALAERGLKPNDLQCIGFKTPVVFAESRSVPDNAYVADLYEQVSFLGDLHRQIADVPNGGKVRLKVGQPPSDPIVGETSRLRSKLGICCSELRLGASRTAVLESALCRNGSSGS